MTIFSNRQGGDEKVEDPNEELYEKRANTLAKMDFESSQNAFAYLFPDDLGEGDCARVDRNSHRELRSSDVVLLQNEASEAKEATLIEGRGRGRWLVAGE